MTVGELREMLAPFMDHETIVVARRAHIENAWRCEEVEKHHEIEGVETNSLRLCQGPRAILLVSAEGR